MQFTLRTHLLSKLTLSLFFSFVLLLTTSVVSAQESGPLLYIAENNNAKVYILGGTDAQDNSWLTEKIVNALTESSSLWVEIPPANPDQSIPELREDVLPSDAMHPTVIAEGYGNLRLGDYLDVAMGERSVVESQRLNLTNVNYAAMQPWLAYYTFAFAFWPEFEFNDPEAELVALARKSDIPVNSLFNNRDEFFKYMGRMGDFAQTHYFQFLYNSIDWQRSGEYDQRFSWITGEPDEQWLERIKAQTPDYYRYAFVRRNPVIAEQITSWLNSDEVTFLYLDINKTLGEESVIEALREMGITVSSN